MLIHNTRSPKQWEAIEKYVDVKGKSVMDVGCGAGDILYFMQEGGAVKLCGIDQDLSLVNERISRFDMNRCRFLSKSIEQLMKLYMEKVDVAICFSVIPYVASPLDLLLWLRNHSNVSLVEMQYAGDGPGPAHITDDWDMLKALEEVWDTVYSIGSTNVEGRGVSRTLWYCSNS